MIFDAFDADHNGEWNLQEFNTFQQALGKESVFEDTLTNLFGESSVISFEAFLKTYETYPAARVLEMIRQLGVLKTDMVKGSFSITSTLNEHSLKGLDVLLNPLRWADTNWKKLLVLARSTKDFCLELHFSNLAELLHDYYDHDTIAFVNDPLLVASWVERIAEFIQPPHAEHSKDRPCRSIFCSMEREIVKTEQQLEFDDQSKKLPRGTSARRAEAMVPFLEMAKLVKAHVRGPEILEIHNKSIRLREGDSERLWAELAITQFQLWEAHVRVLHLPSILDISSATLSKRTRCSKANAKPLHTVLFQEAYSTFLIAMEYPHSKSSPELLLPLARLYIEYGSYRGALAVCTLLVEGYPTSSRLNEAIFLSALTASALNRHRESAQYFQFLAEGQGPSSSFPYRLAAYQFNLLAALELSRVPGMRALEREMYVQAYKALVTLPPALPSEKTAHTLFTTSRKNEEQRTLLWCRDVQTWVDLAQRLAGPANAPLLVLSALGEARRRMKPASGGLPSTKLLLEGTSLLRTGDNVGAERVFQEVLLKLPRDVYYSTRHERFLLEICSASWRERFALENSTSARLQMVLRRRWRLSKWRLGVAHVLEQRRHAMATRIQCAWRGFRARQELALLRKKQQEKEALANIAMGKQDDRLIELQLNAAARKIQSLLPIARDKRTLRALRAQKYEREALLAKFAGRRTELGQLGVFRRLARFTSTQKRERLDAIVLIQRQFRAWRSRKLCLHLLLLRRQQNSILQQCLVRRSASMMSRVFQAWHTMLVDARSERDWASRRIQRRYRSKIAVRQYHTELRRHRAATATMNRLLSDRRRQKLLTSWRALSNHALVRRLRRRGAAVNIQKHVRGVLARKQAKRLRARRRRTFNILTKLTRSREYQLLQMGFDLLHEHVEAYHRRRYGAVFRLQGLFRGFRTRQRLHQRRTAVMLVNGTASFGCRFKGHPPDITLWACLLALSRYISQRGAAVVQVQQWWRQRQKRIRTLRILSKRAAQRRLFCSLQQNFYTLARIFFRELRAECNAKTTQQHAAATKIQQQLRCWLMRRRYLSTLDRCSVAAQRGEKAARKLSFQRVRRLFYGWREETRATRREQHEAACLIQQIFRRHRAQRQARSVLAKRAAQTRLLAAASQKPLERCFRQWEAAALLEKSVLRVRSSSLIGSRETTPVTDQRKPDSASGSKFDKPLTLEEVMCVCCNRLTTYQDIHSATYSLHSFSGGIVFKGSQLRQLISLSTSVIIDGGGGLSSSSNFFLNLNEQVVDALDVCSSSNTCPVQSLILYNAPLRPSHASLLATVLQRSRRSSNLALVSVVLANVPLAPVSVVCLACALAQSPTCLQQLVLERCQVGSAGAAALFEALTYNRALWKLDLSGNHIADAACPSLARALLGGSQLRVLALSRNFLSDRGVLGYLAPSLASSQLETLVLLHNPRVSSLGIAALQAATATTSPSSDLLGLRVVSD
ncbi:Myosin-like protein [Phytophthora palmivora]|uniref:Myosin-like protein n=1 Tax=Phytophthora palmivora TaxID=4796 RepID=A0A2P4XG85_9STRA|nr:Myosin-like protein [Phytophthora palmivora]